MHLKISSVKWRPFCPRRDDLTHWGWATHICVGKLTIIGSDNGLSPGRHQAIIWTNTGILLIRPWGTNFSDLFYRKSNIFIQDNARENVVCEMASISSRPQCVTTLNDELHSMKIRVMIRMMVMITLVIFCLMDMVCNCLKQTQGSPTCSHTKFAMNNLKGGILKRGL